MIYAYIGMFLLSILFIYLTILYRMMDKTKWCRDCKWYQPQGRARSKRNVECKLWSITQMTMVNPTACDKGYALKWWKFWRPR